MRSDPDELEHRARVRELRTIPGVGPAVAGDLLNLGITRVADLRGQDPQVMYERLCVLQGCHVDRCMLYTLRCAVYFASARTRDPALLQWWAWKDRELTPELLR
jgi:hypothetical protein